MSSFATTLKLWQLFEGSDGIILTVITEVLTVTIWINYLTSGSCQRREVRLPAGSPGLGSRSIEPGPRADGGLCMWWPAAGSCDQPGVGGRSWRRAAVSVPMSGAWSGSDSTVSHTVPA